MKQHATGAAGLIPQLALQVAQVFTRKHALLHNTGDAARYSPCSKDRICILFYRNALS
jgi:hypothetical protein